MGHPAQTSRRLVAVEASTPGAGDEPVRERLREAFRAFHGKVYATAHRILADPHEAEDVAQTVFERLAHRLHTIRDQERLGSFLEVCAVRECLVLLRRRRWWTGRRAARVLAPVRATPEEPAAAYLVTAVRELLLPLSGEERVAVVLKLVEEHSHEEVARIMGISVATARRRLASARRRMLEHANDDTKRRLVAELEVCT
jgi:RNA polymerase sigma-70 factor, ECF subfamily